MEKRETSRPGHLASSYQGLRPHARYDWATTGAVAKPPHVVAYPVAVADDVRRRGHWDSLLTSTATPLNRSRRGNEAGSGEVRSRQFPDSSTPAS
jgi:hypothetical protein